MFDIYIANYLNSSGETVGSWNKVLTIPMGSKSAKWMVQPSLKAEMGKAESFDFTVNPGSDYYNAFVELKTLIRIDYGSNVVFYGRVVTVNTSGLLQVKSIHAEGLFAVLRDSQQEGIDDEKRPKVKVLDFLESTMAAHNQQVESWKNIALDRNTVTAEFSRTDTKKLASTSWRTTLDALNDLVSQYGGYMRVRYQPNSSGGGTPYLDWKSNYFRDLGDGRRPHIEIAKNLIDLSKSSEVNEIFTRFIPIGTKSVTTASKESRAVYINSQKWFSVKDLCNQTFSGYTANDLNNGFHSYNDYLHAEDNYGIIYKTMSFSNADNASTLKSYALDWVKKNYYGALQTYSVKAVDMHIVDGSEPEILVGDCVDITYPITNQNGSRTTETRKLVCKSLQYNLFNPEQNTYTFGIPSDLLDFEYGEKKKKSGKTTASNGYTPKNTNNDEETTEVSWSAIRNWLLYWYDSCESVSGKNEDGSPKVQHPSWAYTYRDKTPAITYHRNGELNMQGIFSISTSSQNSDGATVYTDQETVCRIIGRYNTKGPNAANYGVGVTPEGRVFAFAWAVMSQQPPWSIEFYIPGISKQANEGLNVESLGSALIDEDTGNTIWTDPVTGQTVAEISAENNNASFGYTPSGDWYVKLNDKIEYEDTDPNSSTYGQIVTAEGFVTAYDFHVPEIPSFKTKFAVVDQLIAAKATIGELRAFEALIGDWHGAQTDADGNITSFEGTALKTNADQIQGVSGKFEIDSSGNLIVKDGGSFYVRRDGVNLGLMDEGKLGGGFNVTYETNEQGKRVYTTTVAGDVVKIGQLDNEDLNSWAKDAKDGKGVFAKYLTVKKLTAEEITTLLANIGSATIDGLSDLNYVTAQEIDVTDNLTAGSVEASVFRALSSDGSGTAFNVTDITKNSNTGLVTVYRLTGGNITFSHATSLSGEWRGENIKTFYVYTNPTSTNISVPVYVEFDGSYMIGDTANAVIKPTLSGSTRLMAITVDIGTVDSDGKRTVSAKAGSKTAQSKILTDYSDGRKAATVKITGPTTNPISGDLTYQRTFTYKAENNYNSNKTDSVSTTMNLIKSGGYVYLTANGARHARIPIAD